MRALTGKVLEANVVHEVEAEDQTDDIECKSTSLGNNMLYVRGTQHNDQKH